MRKVAYLANLQTTFLTPLAGWFSVSKIFTLREAKIFLKLLGM